MIRLWREPDPVVDVYDLHRQRTIREAEYQAQCDAESQILRISGKCRKPDGIPIKAIVTKERVRP